MTREEWFEQAIDRVQSGLDMASLNIPQAIPPKAVRVSCGWPSRRATARKNRRLGECWPFDSTPDGIPQIFISPAEKDSAKVLGILVHELGHAYFKKGTGHRSVWKKLMAEVGYEYPANAPGPVLAERLNAVVAELGEYPHEALDPNTTQKKQTTRLRLWVCRCAPPVRVRVASDEFQAKCLICGDEFEAV